MENLFRKTPRFSSLKPRDKTWKEIPVNRICFRGDTRPPAEFLRMPEVIFNPASLAVPTMSAIQQFDNTSTPIDQTGFQPKPGGPAVPQYKQKTNKGPQDKVFRHDSEAKMKALKSDVIGAGDIGEGGVCVTTDFYVAPLFPFKEMGLFTWIYVVLVESGYDTHFRQCKDALEVMKRIESGNKAQRRGQAFQAATSGLGSLTSEDAGSIMGTLYGQELVVTEIPVTHVVCAVRCWRDVRDFRNGDYATRGVAYELREEFWINPICKQAADNGVISAELRGRALQFLIDESLQNPKGRTPAVSDGFARNLN